MVEDDALRPTSVICARIPIKAPKGAILRSESAIDLLERVKKLSQEWIQMGHRDGINSHNVSATISIDKNQMYASIKEDWGGTEWEVVGEWMWENREFYNGLSVLPKDNGTYVQAPFESISEEEYIRREKELHNIDLTKVIELDDTINFGAIQACAGGACEVN